MKYNTRIAPSNTGHMHIGTVRTAYFNWLAARASGGKFTLRIDDTDKARSEEQYVDSIIKTMDWLGLKYDYIVQQSNRFDVYRKHAEGLIENGWAVEKDGAIYLSLKENHQFPDSWNDEISGKIPITKDNLKTINDSVLIKSDGTPSYNFCTVIDDIYLGINLVIRGTDHMTNTSKQVVLFNLLDKPLPKFAHVGLIGLNGKPLSKREGAASVLYYREKGYSPEAVLNFIARLGWGPTVDDKTTALLPREKMLEMFLTKGKMKASLANMDLIKLESFDRKYKARLTNA